MDAHTTFGVLQIVLGVVAFAAIVTGFFAGTRFNAMAAYDALPVAMLIVGIIGTVVCTIALGAGAPLIICGGLYAATFVGGFGLGMQVQPRNSD